MVIFVDPAQLPGMQGVVSVIAELAIGIAAVGAFVVSMMNRHKAIEIHALINSRLSELVLKTEIAATALGRKQGSDEQLAIQAQKELAAKAKQADFAAGELKGSQGSVVKP
jgi:hypothetical protein